MWQESQTASQLPQVFKCSTSKLRGKEEACNHLFETPDKLIAKVLKGTSKISTCRHVPSKLPLSRYPIQVSRSVRPTKVQKAGRSTKSVQPRRNARWLEKLRNWLAFQPDQQTFHEVELQSDGQAAFFPRATKNHRRLWQKNKLMSLDVPYENFIGSILGGRFQLQFLRCQEDHLDIYSVTSLCGLSFEAQAFSLSGLSEKLLQARKRRMKRLLQSKNFVCEIQQAGKRFLIIDVERSDVERKNLGHQNNQPVPDSMSQSSWTEDLPYLLSSRYRKETDSVIDNVSTWSSIQNYKLQDTNSVASSSRPPSSLNSLSSSSSYAEVASKGLENDKSSKTRKGVKQRQRRQRKRAGKDNPVAPADRSADRKLPC